MAKKTTAKKAAIAAAVILLMILPLCMGAGYLVWISGDKASDAYKFFAGLFGERNDYEEPRYAYDPVYPGAKPIDPNFKSPLYYLSEDTLEDIPAISYYDNLPEEAVAELYMPAGLRYEGIGLFVCYIDDNGGVGIKKTTSQAGLDLFDATKPTFLFIHGMQRNFGARYDEGVNFLKPVIEAGYNVLLFRWSQFCDEETPMIIEPKLWGTTKDKGLVGMRWRNTDNKYVTDDIPNASMAEIFGAYYIDFMLRFNYTGSLIQFTGHSMGGQLLFSSMSYLLTKEQEGLISPALLPDKVTAFDPYFAPFKDDVYCQWLGKKISEYVFDEAGNPVNFPNSKSQRFTSSMDTIADTAVALRNRGIACEYVPSISGYVHLLMQLFDPNDPAIDRFKNNCVVLEYRSDWTDITDFNSFHLAGREWYMLSALQGYLMDNALNNPTDFAPTATTPLSYFYARVGTVYRMEPNYTIDVEDDIIYSDNVTGAKIAGFAFYDANANGVYDERLQARVPGVKLELYMKDGYSEKLIATRITDESGYYSFDIPRINANGFDKFYIRAVAPTGYQICDRGGEADMMGNDINPTDGRSDAIILKHFKNLKIINIGVRKVS